MKITFIYDNMTKPLALISMSRNKNILFLMITFVEVCKVMHENILQILQEKYIVNIVSMHRFILT